MGLTSKLKLKKDHSLESVDHESSQSTDDVDEMDSENQSILLNIISQLRPGSDLTKITLPTFILEKKSMLERIANAFFTPQILLEANKTDDALKRFALIVKWYLSCWHIAPKAVKKPLNPILGETFSCYWDDLPDGNTSYYLAEQTSHHPPKSSYFYLLPEQKIKTEGVIVPRSKFLGNSSAAMMEGVAKLTLGAHEEEYTVTQPNVYCRGILFGKLKYELGDHVLLKCEQSGFEADIEFKTKGFISGAYDVIEGVIRKIESQEVMYTITGKWNEVIEIKDVSGNSETLTYDTDKAIIHKPKVKPIEQQLENESRRLWKSTIDALEDRDHNLATEEKSKVEEEQREKAKKRAEEGISFVPSLFDETDGEIPFIIKGDFDLKNSPEKLKENLLSSFPIVSQ